jgi:hypothetical protein
VKKQALSPEIEALWLSPLPEDEFARRVEQAIGELDGEEGEHVLGLIRWFRRRYPTAKERFAHARRRYESVTRPQNVWSEKRNKR